MVDSNHLPAISGMRTLFFCCQACLPRISFRRGSHYMISFSPVANVCYSNVTPRRESYPGKDDPSSGECSKQNGSSWYITYDEQPLATHLWRHSSAQSWEVSIWPPFWIDDLHGLGSTHKRNNHAGCMAISSEWLFCCQASLLPRPSSRRAVCPTNDLLAV